MENCLSITPNLADYRIATGTSAEFVVPVNGSGERPKYIAVTCTGAVYFELGDSSVTAIGNAAGTGKSMLLSPYTTTIFRVDSATYYAIIELTTVGSLVSIVPLENEGGTAAPSEAP